MNKLGIVITDGVGYRNFILSNFITEAQHSFDKVVLFSCLPKSVYDDLDINCTIVELRVYQEKFPTWFFRKAKELTHLYVNATDNLGIQDNIETNRSTLKTPRGYATRFLHRWTSVFKSEKWIQRYTKLQQLSFKSNPITRGYIDLLKNQHVDLLFFTHQRPPYSAPLIYAAEVLNIKTAAFIFSWDNLGSKGRMAGNFDYYLVWSNLMKRELRQFYQFINEHQIEVVGTPQFEPYILNRYGVKKETFFKRFQLEEDLPILLFSCGDISTSPNDDIYIVCIANAIQQHQLIKKVNLVVRTSPAEEPKRFEQLVSEFPFIKWNYPDWKLSRNDHQESWSQRVPSIQDVSDLKSIVQYCDVAVNMLSTMSLDAMVFQKPIINIIFGNGKNGLVNDQRFLNYTHIQCMVNSKSTEVVKTADELIKAINNCLEHPTARQKEQKEFLALQIGKPIEGTSKRIVETLKTWCA
ncbi:MAG: hypothetical protein Q8S44_07415 [Flavobacteriaceae bacterium]|nr:hypothetical protein [Flavobacteriaceae bacterium]